MVVVMFVEKTAKNRQKKKVIERRRVFLTLLLRKNYGKERAKDSFKCPFTLVLILLHNILTLYF